MTAPRPSSLEKGMENFSIVAVKKKKLERLFDQGLGKDDILSLPFAGLC